MNYKVGDRVKVWGHTGTVIKIGTFMGVTVYTVMIDGKIKPMTGCRAKWMELAS